jgi:hypothetical protein
MKNYFMLATMSLILVFAYCWGNIPSGNNKMAHTDTIQGLKQMHEPALQKTTSAQQNKEGEMNARIADIEQKYREKLSSIETKITLTEEKLALKDAQIAGLEKNITEPPEKEETNSTGEEIFSRGTKHIVNSPEDAINKYTELFSKRQYDDCIVVLKEGLKLADKNDNAMIGTLRYYLGEAYNAKGMTYVALLELRKSQQMLSSDSQFTGRIKELLEKLEN